MRVFLVPKTPTASCGPFFPLRTAWSQQRAWHRPGNRCMDGCAGSALFPAHYGAHRVAATPHCSAYRLRERGRSSWTFVQVECHSRKKADYNWSTQQCCMFRAGRKRNMSASLFCQTCGFAIPAQATSCAACGAAIRVDADAAAPPVQTPSSSPTPVPPPFAAPTPAACVLPAGFLLAGRYKILRQIGQGGFATVYNAQYRSQKHLLVAIKQIHLDSRHLQQIIDASEPYYLEVTNLFALRT